MILYPAQIDNSTSLPTATDTVTGVNASLVNGLTNAIITIETTLGLNPATVYGNVRARLDVIEAALNLSGSTAPIVFNGTTAPSSLPAAHTGVIWCDSTTAQVRLMDAGGQVTTLGGVALNGTTFGLTALPVSTGSTTIRDRIDGQFSVLSNTTLVFNYQMPTSSYGSIARFEGTLQGLGGTEGSSYIAVMYAINFVMKTKANGTPAFVTGSTQNGNPTYDEVVDPNPTPYLTITGETGSIVNFSLANAYINGTSAYWQAAIDVTMMESKL